MSVPAISVILPTYNRGAVLRRAIDSVLVQTFDRFELIVIDDGSTDDTPALLAAISDPRLRVARMPANAGAAAARNRGLELAQADWVAFQDSDDEWRAGKLLAQWHAREAAPQAGLVLCGYQLAPPDNSRVLPEETLAGRDPRIDILDGWPIITPTWLVRRDWLKAANGFDPAFTCLEDWDLAFRLYRPDGIVAVAGEHLVKHGAADSVCANPMRLATALETILARHGPAWHDQPVRLARRLAHLGTLQYRAGRRTDARASLRRARQLHPGAATWGLSLAGVLGRRALSIAARLWPRHASMQR